MITAVCISTRCSMFRLKINIEDFWCDCFTFQQSWMFKDKFITCIRIFLYNTGEGLKHGLAFWSAIFGENKQGMCPVCKMFSFKITLLLVKCKDMMA